MSSTPSKGIKSFGAYVPRRRLSRAAIAEAHAWSFPSLKGLGKGEKSFCNWDEDVITMSVEAGSDCLRGVDAASVGGVDLASTTAPYADMQNSILVSSVLQLPSKAACNDFSGSSRAGLSALVRACNSSAPGNRLVIAADKRVARPGSTQEMLYGSAAAAVLIGEGEDLIARVLGSEAASAPFFDHFRQAGQKYDYNWEERWVRDEGIARLVPPAVSALLERIGRRGEQIAWFGMAGGPKGGDQLVAKALKIAPERVLPNFDGQIGDCGTAQSMLQLVAALEAAQPGDLIVVASFSGGCEVVAFEMLKKPNAEVGRRGLAGSIKRRIPETAYLKLLSFDGELELDWGMRAETDSKTALTEYYRSSDQILGFVGGQCEQCRQVQFPRMPACVKCGAAGSLKPYSLLGKSARVATYTADWLMYTPAPPLYVGLVQFDVGARVLMEMVDVGAGGLDVGTPLEMTYRIKERDKLRHFDRYFWKATPVVQA